MDRPVTPVAASDRPGRFPTLSMVRGSYVQHHRNVGGTSRGSGARETMADGVLESGGDDVGSGSEDAESVIGVGIV